VRIGERTVHRLGFGTMQLTGPGVWGPPSDDSAAIAVIRRAAECGVTLFDTADSYGPDIAEDLVREALHPYADDITLATKAGLTRPGPDQWEPCGRPEYLRQRCQASLRRLGVDRIDLFQLHRIDPGVPAEDQFGALADLRHEGLVAEVGLSEVTVEQIEEAQRIVPVASVQNQYNLAQRSAEPVVDYCDQHGIVFIPWFPLGNGALARPGGPIDEVADQLGATVPQVSLAWLLRRAGVMTPIPGTSSLDHCTQNCAADQLALSDAQFDLLDAARRPLRRWALTG
jgi:aryl-alcohol dehydrogenase-like predicted oxidoreductase